MMVLRFVVIKKMNLTLFLIRVGRCNANITQDIQLRGSYINEEHCIFENKDGEVTLIPFDSCICYMNGSRIMQPTVVSSGGSSMLCVWRKFLSLCLAKVGFLTYLNL